MERAALNPASLDALEKTMGPDAARIFARRLLGFLKERVGEIPAAFAGGDAEAVRSCVHKLASNAAALGALQLSALAREIEAQCHAGESAGALARQDELATAAAAAITALEARLG
ncbi:MAG TPA: Hpt domain-containing protein [Patescibacteria group bacterium]|nr:Hpt domain-containing protein [Patescibacteria group bacterium]